jgi:bacillolysin
VAGDWHGLGRAAGAGWRNFLVDAHNGAILFTYATQAVQSLPTMTNDGSQVLPVVDVAVVTYLGMARLVPLATFSAALQAVVDVV